MNNRNLKKPMNIFDIDDILVARLHFEILLLNRKHELFAECAILLLGFFGLILCLLIFSFSVIIDVILSILVCIDLAIFIKCFYEYSQI